MSKKLLGIVLVLVVAALVPLGLIALSRSRPSPARPVHLVLDMDKQPKFKGQRHNAMFSDGRAMRPRIVETAAREDLLMPTGPNAPAPPPPFADAASYDRIMHGVERQTSGKMGYVAKIPVPVTLDLVERGRERYNIYCSACHGLSGYGDGMVARRAAEFQAAGSDIAMAWVSPANYHTDELRGRAVGSLFNTITNGVRTMPAHGVQVPVIDRWAIVAYIKALQRSQNAKPGDWPEAEKDRLEAAIK
jgi:mono/diheme cytochrome c family protein